MSSVSVVIPTYNRAQTIERALRSVAAQTLVPLEVIVSDDCSTDGTLEVVRGLESSLSCRLVVQSLPENLGAAAARNAAIAVARGEFVAFLDSDDAWKPEKLARQVAFLEARPDFAGVGCNGTVVRSDGSRAPLRRTDFAHSVETEIADLLLEWYIVTSALVVRREALMISGLFDLSLRKGQDRDLFMRLPRLGHLGFINEDLISYWAHDRSISKEMSLDTGPTYLPVIRNAVWFWRDVLTPDDIRAIMATAHRTAATDAGVAGGVGRTLYHSAAAVRYGASLKSALGSLVRSVKNRANRRNG